jgi:hypothetical protein
MLLKISFLYRNNLFSMVFNRQKLQTLLQWQCNCPFLQQDAGHRALHARVERLGPTRRFCPEEVVELRDVNSHRGDIYRISDLMGTGTWMIFYS